MGVMTLQNFQDDLKDALGRSPDLARMSRWVNNALREVAYAFKFQLLEATGTFNTVEGQTNYALANDYRVMGDDGVRITSPQDRFGGILTAETRTQYFRWQRYNNSSNYGRPTNYHIYSAKMFLRPTPDATVTAIEYDYWKVVTPLGVPTDVSPLTDDWDDIIFRGALYRGHLAYGEHDRMINVYNLFLGEIRSRVSDEDLEEFPEGGISYIQSRFDNNVR